jgi:hypothetical protein
MVISTDSGYMQDMYRRWEIVESIVGVQKSWNSYILKTVQNTPTTHHCIYFTLHFTVYLLISTFTDSNGTLKSWYTLPNQRYNVESLG